MMKNYSILLIVLLFILLISYGFSEENISSLKSSVIEDLYNLKDPFVSLLPHEKEPVEEKIVAPIKEQLIPAQPEVSPPKFSIKGLLWGSDMPQAIIEDQVVKIGDKIKVGAKGRGESGEEIEIINIDKDGMGILYKGRVFFINK